MKAKDIISEKYIIYDYFETDVAYFLHFHNIAHLDISKNFLINKKLNVKLNDFDCAIITNDVNIKKIDYFSFASMVYRMIFNKLSYPSIKGLTIDGVFNNINYNNCREFLSSLQLR
jgi:serine/threonine protein kinase